METINSVKKLKYKLKRQTAAEIIQSLQDDIEKHEE